MSLHVDTVGSGAPLLLIHGWGMHGGIWDTVATRLAQDFCVHCVDFPGHGYSSQNNQSSPYSLDSIVYELSSQFSEPLAVCGWSLGGQIALRWAQLCPQEIDRLMLVASTPCFVQQPGWPCAMSAETLAEFSSALLQNYEPTLKRFIALQLRGSERERELLADLRQRLFSRGKPDVAALQGGLEILRNTDLRAQMNRIMQATLVIAGERDLLTPLPAANYLAQNLPAARMVKIAGAAHAPFLSHPDIFVKHITDFMHE